MPKFSVESETPTIHGTVDTRGDEHDLNLRLAVPDMQGNGPIVAYISSQTGKLRRLSVSDANRQRLEAAGIKFDGNKIATE